MLEPARTPGAGDRNDLQSEPTRLRQENTELRRRLGLVVAEPQVAYATATPELPLVTPPPPQITNASPVQDKIKLFRSLFHGREDVYAERWGSDRTGKKGYSPACENRWSQDKSQPRKYFPLTDQVVHEHLSGTKTIGAFPLLKDNTCWFLACDFDKEGWKLDAVAFLEVCKRYGVPAYLERSRSGNGGHMWIFFAGPVPAVSARQLGMRLLRETMDVRGDLDLGSYDRFFPNQDFVPRGGFGNLIALPLQKKCRVLGNTEFLDASTTELRPNFPNIVGLDVSNLRRLEDIIHMQCGPIRHRMAESAGAPLGRLAIRETDFTSQYGDGDKIQELFRELVHDERRNALIEADILAALKAGRRCLVLSHWKEHCRSIADGLARRGKNVFMLVGGQGKKERAGIINAIQDTPPEQDLVLVATGQYLGEGFDCPKIDTLFMTFPVAFRGKLVQYVGRILREYPGKQDSLVYEYVDAQAPCLKKMHTKRLKAYKSIGFEPDGLRLKGFEDESGDDHFK